MPSPVDVDSDMLRRIRAARDMSQTELARKAGITVATLSRLENGWTSSRTTVRKLAEVLEVEVSWLLGIRPEDLFPGPPTRRGRPPQKKKPKEELIET